MAARKQAGTFLGKDPNDNTHAWKEWYMQAYCIQEGRRAGYLVSGGMEQGQRGGAERGRAKATGLTAGWPDTSWVMPDGVVVFVEYKRKAGGVVSEEQADMHNRMRGMGHKIEVIWADCPADCWRQTLGVLRAYSDGGERT